MNARQGINRALGSCFGQSKSQGVVIFYVRTGLLLGTRQSPHIGSRVPGFMAPEGPHQNSNYYSTFPLLAVFDMIF